MPKPFRQFFLTRVTYLLVSDKKLTHMPLRPSEMEDMAAAEGYSVTMSCDPSRQITEQESELIVIDAPEPGIPVDSPPLPTPDLDARILELRDRLIRIMASTEISHELQCLISELSTKP